MGREIGGCVYVHRNYELVLGDLVSAAHEQADSLFNYTVVKLNGRTCAVTFIDSPDFDTAPEPTVGDQWLCRVDGTTRFMPMGEDPFVYHHKWTMVGEDYAGFDVADSRERSRLCLAVPGIDRSRIGRRSHWLGVALPRIREWYENGVSEMGAAARVVVRYPPKVSSGPAT